MEHKEQQNKQPREDDQDHHVASPCEHCGADTHEEVVKAASWSDRGLVAIEGIPARVCKGCGEQFYDEETTGRIEKVMAGAAGKARQEVIAPVFSLTDVEVPEGGSSPARHDDEEMGAVESMFSGTEQARQGLEGDQKSQEAFLCTYCQSHTHEELVKSVVWTDKGLVAIEDIPARVCHECREQFYDQEIAWKIARLTERCFPAEKVKREVPVPVFSLADIEVPREET